MIDDLRRREEPVTNHIYNLLIRMEENPDFYEEWD